MAYKGDSLTQLFNKGPAGAHAVDGAAHRGEGR
jgi:hypothetical protein